MGGKAKRFEDLLIWQRAHKLALRVYELTQRFPTEERWGLTAQMRTAVLSLPANIAESDGRYYYRDKLRFLYNARGSLAELRSHSYAARDLGYLDRDAFESLYSELEEIRRGLQGYLDSVWQLAHLPQDQLAEGEIEYTVEGGTPKYHSPASESDV